MQTRKSPIPVSPIIPDVETGHPRFPVDSAGIGNREIPRFPIRSGNGKRGPDCQWPQIGKSGIPSGCTECGREHSRALASRPGAGASAGSKRSTSLSDPACLALENRPLINLAS